MHMMSSADEHFRSLQTGVHFDRSSFKKDMSVFESGTHADSGVVQSGSHVLPLDYFGDEEVNDGKSVQRSIQPAVSLVGNRKKFNRKILTQGNSVPEALSPSLSSLSSLLPSWIMDSLVRTLNPKTLTPVQQQAIPVLLARRDMLACAPTGSGKTLAFLLPLLSLLDEKKEKEKKRVRLLVTSPTRELAMQLYRECLRLVDKKKCDVSIVTAGVHLSDSLNEKDILVCTPQRLCSLIEKEGIDLSSVEHIVFDEADKLWEMGFLPQIDMILTSCSLPSCQRSLFSATLPEGVEEMARTVLIDPIRLVIGMRNVASQDVKQSLLFCGNEEGKRMALREMFSNGKLSPPVLVFVQSVRRAIELCSELQTGGYLPHECVRTVHSEMTPDQREETVRMFRCGKVWVLVCTDVLSRGMDFKGVKCVLSYDFPQSTVSHVHRIGRTGRGGHKGDAITFFTEEDGVFLQAVVGVMRAAGTNVPEWMLQLNPTSRRTKREWKEFPIKRESICDDVEVKDKKKRKKNR